MDTRSAPQQQRSRDKYQRVLAAAAELLEELPYDTIGTKLIAARAGVSVGSLYRFFVDKQAIVDALARHWLDRLVDLLDGQLSDLPADPAVLVERLVDGYTGFWRAEPGFRKVWVGLGAGRRTDPRFVDRLHAVLAYRYGIDDRCRLDVAVDVAEHLLNQAFRNDPDGDPTVLRELTVLLTRYLDLRPARPRTPGPAR
jgi:AcrR family transcriptional regulator